jgi:hypothetical protein
VAVTEMMNHFVKTFESNVIHLVQQKYSKLRRTVTERSPGPTEKHAFRVVGKGGDMTSRATASSAAVGADAWKRTATPWADTAYDDRVVVPAHYGCADSFSEAEVQRMLTNPASIVTQKHAAQVGRQIDDVIITAAFAAALDSAGNSNSHPAGSQVGGATQAFDFDFVKLIRESMLEKDIDPDEEIFMVVSPNAVSQLLAEPQATSADYASMKALMGGNVVQGWMGFSWIISNRLTDASPTSAQRYGIAYTRDAIGLLMLQDARTKVGEDPGTWFDTTILTTVDLGAVRIQDEKCFRVHYLESN